MRMGSGPPQVGLNRNLSICEDPASNSRLLLIRDRDALVYYPFTQGVVHVEVGVKNSVLSEVPARYVDVVNLQELRAFYRALPADRFRGGVRLRWLRHFLVTSIPVWSRGL